MHTSEEQWLPVVGYEGLYEVSDQGEVRALPPRHAYQHRMPGYLLRQENYVSGHRRVRLRDGQGVTRRHFVHVLLMTAFVGPRPGPGMECRHLDGKPAHNVLGNLRWGTRSENVLDRVDHGVHCMTRKTHCPQGHPYDETNTYVRIVANGRIHRDCKTCRAWRSSPDYRKKRKAERN